MCFLVTDQHVLLLVTVHRTLFEVQHVLRCLLHCDFIVHKCAHFSFGFACLCVVRSLFLQLCIFMCCFWLCWIVTVHHDHASCSSWNCFTGSSFLFLILFIHFCYSFSPCILTSYNYVIGQLVCVLFVDSSLNIKTMNSVKV